MRVTLSRKPRNEGNVDYLKRILPIFKTDPVIDLEDHPTFPEFYRIVIGGDIFAKISKKGWRDYFDLVPLSTKPLLDYG